MINNFYEKFYNAVKVHMEMDFGFRGRVFHINFIDDDSDKVEISEIFFNGSLNNGTVEVFDNIERLMTDFKVGDVSFSSMLSELDFLDC